MYMTSSLTNEATDNEQPEGKMGSCVALAALDWQRKVQKHVFLFCNSTLGGQSVAWFFAPDLFEFFYNPAHTCQVSALSLCLCVCVISTWVTEQARASGMMLSHLWRCFQNRRVRVRVQDQLSLLTKENPQIRPSGPAH